MAHSTQHGTQNLHAPNAATDAVLKPSAPVSPEAKVIGGIDFNHYTNKVLTVEALVGHMSGMGFQATAVSEAVQIINDMVSPDFLTRTRMALFN